MTPLRIWLAALMIAGAALLAACATDTPSASPDGDGETDEAALSDGDTEREADAEADLDDETDSDPEPDLDEIVDADPEDGDGEETEQPPESTLSWLSARSGEQPGIFDEDGRHWLLRGVNFNHLGDYWQVDPSLPTVAELGPQDWDDAAAYGVNVIRLVTSWSLWEPERGRFDDEYLARVRAVVAEANAHDMYVVIDMHQDAWSRYVFTPAEESCPDGTSHQKGWDGAPLWATFTDDQPTCTPGSREESPAVLRAWTNFYANREGIRDELVWVWGHIARAFAHHSGVAGFDLLNEPGQAETATGKGLSGFYRAAIAAIRAAEAETGGRGHVLFFEPSVKVSLPDFDLSDDPQLVFAAHNYIGSINSDISLLGDSFGLYAWLAGQYGGRSVWIGEYGAFGDRDHNDTYMTQYAAYEDLTPQSGGAWWQWAQRCGDPHSVQHPLTADWLIQQQATCDDLAYTRRYSNPPARCISRAYPRAVPGRLVSIEAGACDGHLAITGETQTPGLADLWYPSDSETEPVVGGEGVTSFQTRRVSGGYRIEAAVSGTYRIEVDPAEQSR